MKKFSVSFVYKEELIDDIFEGESADDVIFNIEGDYEAEAFYDNHYISDLKIEEITDELP